MTTADVARIAKEIVALWGVSDRSFWGQASDERSREARTAAEYFAGFLPERIMRAVRDCSYDDAKRAPNIAQILERARSEAREKGPSARPHPDNCSHPKPWAVADALVEPTRDAWCRVCLLEFRDIPADKVRTDSEIEERQRSRKEAPRV